MKVLVIAILVGQVNENAIALRLIGGMTGLNPALVFISLLIGAKVGGILGLLLVAPIASFIKRMTDTLRDPAAGKSTRVNSVTEMNISQSSVGVELD